MLLWDVLARSSAVLIVAGLAAAALRGRSAALRHAVWACGLAGALAVAPLSWVLPTWHVPLVPALSAALDAPAAAAPRPGPALEQPSSAPALVATVATRVATRVPSRVAERVPSRIAERVPARLAAKAGSSVEANDGAAPGTNPGPPAGGAPTTASTPPAGIDVPWGALLLGLWALGTLLLLSRLAAANLATFRTLRARTSGIAPWLATARRLARMSGVPRTRFVRSDAITMPMAAGYLRPTVVLPTEADAWPDERLEAVLLHELAHIRRRDCLTQLAASMACALYWMNPLAWYAARALRRERERACDDAVLAAGTTGPAYAEHLLDVARSARHVTAATFSGGVAMAHRSELEGRLMAILDDARNRQSLSYGAAGLAGVLCLALVTPLAALDPWVLGAVQAQPVIIPPGAGPEQPAPKPRPAPAPRPAALAIDVPLPPLAALSPALAVHAEEVEEEVAAEAVEIAAAAHAAVEVEVALVPPTAPVPPMPPVPAAAIAFELQSLPTPAPTPSPTPTPAATPQPPVGPKPGPGPAKGRDRERREATPADPRVIAALGAALKDSDVEVRQQAAHSLGQMRDPAAVDVLLPALQDADVEVRQNVVFALGQLRDPKAIPGLTTALKDSDEEIRQRAAFALSQIRDERAVEPLMIAARDSSSDVRRQALFAISQIDPNRGKDIAIEALKDKDPEVRRMAAHLLGRLR